jgi:hypothetical protein
LILRLLDQCGAGGDALVGRVGAVIDGGANIGIGARLRLGLCLGLDRGECGQQQAAVNSGRERMGNPKADRFVSGSTPADRQSRPEAKRFNDDTDADDDRGLIE